MQVYFLNSLPEFGQPYYIYYLKTDGKYYGWDSQNNKFYNLSTPNIDDLVGLNFDNLQDGDVLSYDSASQTWINKIPEIGVRSFNNRQGDVYLLSLDVTDALQYIPEDVANKQNDLTTSSIKYPTVDAVNAGLLTKEPAITEGTISEYWRGDKTFQILDKSAIGLNNVDNTSDANKPISTATQTALNNKQDLLVSGTNIKTVNGDSLLGLGNITVGGGITVGTTAVTSGTIGRIFFEGAGNVVQEDSALFWDNTNKRLGVGTTPATNVRLDVRAQGALSTDIGFRVRNSANTADTIQVNGTGIFFQAGGRTEMRVTANLINIGLENHDTSITHASSSRTISTQTASSITRTHLATNNTNSSDNTEALNKGCFIIGSTIRAGTFTNVQNKIHFVVDSTKWGLNGIYSAGFQWFKGNQSGDGAFSTATLPSITTGNRQMWLTPENSLLLFNTTGITYTINTDSFQQYSADITAGNAAPHFRTENGSIIKLYRQNLPTNPTNAEIATFLSNLGLANLI